MAAIDKIGRAPTTWNQTLLWTPAGGEYDKDLQPLGDADCAERAVGGHGWRNCGDQGVSEGWKGTWRRGQQEPVSLGGAWCLWSFAVMGQVTRRPAGWTCSEVWCSYPLPGSPCSCWLAPAVCTFRLLTALFLFSSESFGDAKSKHVNANASISIKASGTSAGPRFCLIHH